MSERAQHSLRKLPNSGGALRRRAKPVGFVLAGRAPARGLLASGRMRGV